MSAAGAAPDGPLLMGVRHHGPGSARAVRSALRTHRPRVLLVEGPPEADAVVRLAADPDLVPPVALLAHGVNEPGRAAFWPLAEFSPEWVAIRWAVDHDVPVRFFDLPAAHTLALDAPDCGEPAPGQGVTGGDSDASDTGSGPAEETGGGSGDADPTAGDGGPGGPGDAVRLDPIAVLADAAGYDDPERWWEDVVEHRTDPGTGSPFAAVEEAMTELRSAHGADPGAREAAREAHMRLRLREACREFGESGVAVVCGAWHVPALRERHTVTADRQLLRGLPRLKTEITWVPWTHRRLARDSGYGAGITAPGWYAHLFATADQPVTRWLVKVAGLLRDEDYGISSAHVIEAVRLAETLAAMRGRPLAGLTETLDAAQAVFCDGSDLPLQLVHDRLTVGDVLGSVPDSAPAVPLQRDLSRLQRSLRLKPEAAERTVSLDLRRDTDAERSRLLHRLRLLGISWGERDKRASHSTGTFRESWRLCWQPELSVRVAEAGVWGTTVADAATARAVSLAREHTALAEVTALAERCLLAGLDRALPVVMRELADRAALDTDTGQLARALPPLARAVRYGDVRSTGSAALRRVAEGLAERVCVGLPAAVAGLNQAGASEMRGHLEAAHQAIALLDQGELRDRWRAVLHRLTRRDRVPALLRGRCARLLLDEAALPESDAELLMAQELSAGSAPADSAAWIDGFFGGGGMLLVHDPKLFALLDDWLTRVPAEAFNDALPLLRRVFSSFDAGVRRTLGELARRGTGVRGGPAAGETEAPPGFGPELHPERAEAVLPTLRLLIGGQRPPGAAPSASDAAHSAPDAAHSAPDAAHSASGAAHSASGAAAAGGTGPPAAASALTEARHSQPTAQPTRRAAHPTGAGR